MGITEQSQSSTLQRSADDEKVRVKNSNRSVLDLFLDYDRHIVGCSFRQDVFRFLPWSPRCIRLCIEPKTRSILPAQFGPCWQPSLWVSVRAGKNCPPQRQLSLSSVITVHWETLRQRCESGMGESKLFLTLALTKWHNSSALTFSLKNLSKIENQYQSKSIFI